MWAGRGQPGRSVQEFGGNQPVRGAKGSKDMGRAFAVVLISFSFVAGCGPRAADFVGRYPVVVDETIDACVQGTPRATALQDVTEVVISERTDEHVYVELGPCGFVATVVDKGRFEASDADCSVEYEAPEIVITFSAVGVLEDRQLDLTLTGTYETSEYGGYPVECAYLFHASG